MKISKKIVRMGIDLGKNRSCERPYMDVWAGLQTQHEMRSAAGAAYRYLRRPLVGTAQSLCAK